MGRVKLPAVLPRGHARPLWQAARPYAIVFAISSLIVSRWFRAGTFIATGDMGPWIRRGWEPEALFSWNHQITGAGSAGYTLARWADFLILRVVGALGGDEYIGQWLFYTCAYGLVAVGVAYCASAFVHNEAAVIVAGSFGVLNGFFLTRLPNPLNIISVGSIALVTGLAIRVAQGKKFPLPLAGVALWPTSFLAFNPPMLIVAYAWALGGTVLFSALILGWRAAGRLVRWLIGAAPWVVLLNAWWIVPLAGSFTGGGGATANAQFTDPTSWMWAQINNVPQNVLTMVANWAWFRPQYLPFAADLDQPLIVWVRYLLPALAFLAPVLAVRQRRRLSLVISGLMIVFVVLAKGLMPPFSQFNLFLYLHVPGFWLFREPMSKLGQLLVIFFALQLAVAVEGVWHSARSEGGLRSAPWPVRLRTVGVTGAVCAVLAYPFPLWTGAVVPDSRPTQPSAHVRVPDFWRTMAQSVDADPRPGKVLVLPQDDYYQMPTTWGFFGVDSIANLLLRHPVVQRKPDGYFGDVPGFSANVQAIETALVSGDLAPVPKLLASVGVAKIIIRHDLVRGLPGRHFADDRVLTAAAARVPGLRRVVTGSLDLWTVGSGTAPTVNTFNEVLDAPSRPTAVASALGSADAATALAARRSAGPASANVEVDNSVTATDDVVEWPIPAVDSGTPTGSFTLKEAGTFSIAQRARAAAVLEPSVRGRTLVLHDPTTLRLDGSVVSRRPDSTIALPAGREVLAVTAGTRTVSLDGWSRAALPSARAGAVSRPTVAVGSATELVALARSLRPVSVTPYSEVYDCNNYEPRPAAELGLARTLGRSGGQASVRLTARDHAACSRVLITGVHAGEVLRVRLSYRQVSGKRPQVCIWQVGVDGCADTPRAQLAHTWTPSEVFVRVADNTSSVQVVLHADVGQRLLPETVSEYRGLTVDALDPAVSTSLWPEAPTSRTVALRAGQHTLELAGGLSGSVLGTFEPLQDCFRTDDLTPAQAGVMSQTEGTGQATTFVLGARSHMACLGATIPDMGGSSMYVLSMQARSVGLRNPKFCVYARGPDRCSTLPTAMTWKGWTPYSAVVAADPEAIETRLYLYGLRDLAEKRTSQVEYRQVRLRPVASPSTIVLVRQDGASTKPAEYTWRRANPTRFPATVNSTEGTVAALSETFAPGWTAPGISKSSDHVALQGWMNGWRVPAGQRTGAFTYAPESRARLARLALPAGLVAAAVWIALARWWRRRRGRRRE